ncbi:Nucleoporin FG repeat region family protein [Babesia bovis T2Bo]|uniref:Nucleoporin Nup54 alpha-helical domain-containing protein n=1 Tax=Babesia bovis TaxID=5865 RepID=A7ANT2_BABBO|nr:Nucleoporin FG repeat region family protein [Babesia bovis T2Bo]EDO08216.1 Nucleoporin FG repeat region family protein [Babesia bovis T2Bo]|eukprot:XP_001611784.1 hypothetical protein [Babesia bovis T2Bo]
MATPFNFNQVGTASFGTGGSLFTAPTGAQSSVSNAPTFGNLAASSNTFGSHSSVATSSIGPSSSVGAVANGGSMGFNQPGQPVSVTPQNFHSRCTVRLLTQYVPQWSGHFDVAEVILTAHENRILKMREMVDRLLALDKLCWQSHDNIKNLLNGISLLQSKLHKGVTDRCKRQDTQNMISTKARRLCDTLQSNDTHHGTKFLASFRVPNHLHVQLSKELLDTIRSGRQEIRLLQLEVMSLKDIELSKYVLTVKGVQDAHDKTLHKIADRLSKIVSSMDEHFRDRKDLWHCVADETSDLKRSFLISIGLPVRPAASQSSTNGLPYVESHKEIKKQIDCLRKFNAAFSTTGKINMDASYYNIREMLQKPTPNAAASQVVGAFGTTGMVGTNTTVPGTSLFGTNYGTNAGSVYGTSTGAGSQQTGIGFTGGTVNIFGSNNTTTSGNNLFGNIPTTNTGTSNIFGTTNTGTTGGLFGNANTNTTLASTGTGGLFGSNTVATPGITTKSLFGTTNANTAATSGIFGNTNAGTTSGSSNLFGNTGTATTSTTGLFGNTGTNTTSSTAGLFGGGTTNTTGNTGIFGSSNTGAPTFGANTTGTSGSNIFGSTTNSTGATNLFGNTGASSGVFGSGTSNTTNPFGTTTIGSSSNSGIFGSSTSPTGGQQTGTAGGLFGQPQSTSTTGGLFGNPSNNATFGGTTFGQQTNTSKSTAIVPYNPNPLIR